MPDSSDSDYGPVAVLCPSLGKACGIARYSTYVADSLAKAGRSVSLLRRSAELFRPDAIRFGTVLIQHEYGLFDALSPLGTGETTTELLTNLGRYVAADGRARAAIVMHTVATHDHVLNVMNSQIFSSSIPVFHLNAKGCFDFGIPYLEHGVYAYPRPPRERAVWDSESGEIPKIMGSFGLLSPNKRPTQLIDICARSGSDFLGNFATNDKGLVKAVVQNALSVGVRAQIHADFCSEDELLSRLQGATFAAVAQEGISHSATSGSVRFLFNLGIPVLAPFVPQFADCEDGAIFVHPDRMHRTIETLTSDRRLYREAAERATRFLARNEMGLVYDRLLTLLHETSTRELVIYRKRNFRDLTPEAPLLTVADLCIRPLAAEDAIGEEAAEAALVGALSGETTEAAETLVASVPRSGPVELRIGLDRIVNSLMQPVDRAVFAASERFISNNLRRVGEQLGVNSEIEAKPRDELIRLVRAAVEDKSQLLERRDAVRLLAGSILNALNPQLYPPDIGRIADRLDAVARYWGDQRGFSSRTRFVASIPVLLCIPAAQIISYLARVGGLEPSEIFALIGTLGLPTDQAAARAEWVRSLEPHYPRRPGVGLSPWRPDPRDIRSRSRFFRTELACLPEREFALAVFDVFGLAKLPGGDLERLKRSLRREGRRATLQQLRAAVNGLHDIVVVDLDDRTPNPIDRFDQVESFYRPQSTMRELFLEPHPLEFEYLNRAEKADQLDWLFDVGVNDLFVSRGVGDKPPVTAFLISRELEAALSQGADAAEDEAAAQGRRLLVFGPAGAPADTEFEPGADLLDRARSLGAALVTREAWATEPISDGWSNYPRFIDREYDTVGALPDGKWEEAWRAVVRHPGGRVIGPEELRAVSGRIVPMHIAAGAADSDFVILHKGRQSEYERFLAEMQPAQWHIIYANEVFLVLARRVYAAEAFNPGYVPKNFRRYLRLSRVGLSALLVQLGRRARIS